MNRARRRFRWWRIPLWMILFVCVYVLARNAWVHPSNDRDWKPEHSRAPQVTIDGDQVQIEGFRNFVYHSADDFDAQFETRSYDLSKLESVWFVLSPFRDNWRGPAHSFLSFGFAGSDSDNGSDLDLGSVSAPTADYVSISVEARKEEGESYSVWKGMLRNYELLYVIGDERDLIGLRAVHWNDDVFVYPVKARPDQIRKLFISMLERAEKLRLEPEFYDTALSNCTTNIFDSVKLLGPDDWSYSWKLQLPGYSDEMVFEKGFIDTDLATLEEARAKYRVNDRAAEFFGDPDFSLRIREWERSSATQSGELSP